MSNTDTCEEQIGIQVILDLKEVLKEKFETGQGVLTIGPETQDAVILASIKEAISYSKPFTVLPPMTMFIDELGKRSEK